MRYYSTIKGINSLMKLQEGINSLIKLQNDSIIIKISHTILTQLCDIFIVVKYE